MTLNRGAKCKRKKKLKCFEVIEQNCKATLHLDSHNDKQSPDTTLVVHVSAVKCLFNVVRQEHLSTLKLFVKAS